MSGRTSTSPQVHGVADPAPDPGYTRQTTARPPPGLPRWAFVLPGVMLVMGACGLIGSSGALSSRGDLLLSEEEVRPVREVFGTSRWIRGDEFFSELPAQRAQQRAVPPYPLVNLNVGLGQLQRNPFSPPVVDWGLAFRPLSWAFLLGSRWAHGLRWFARAATILLGLTAWLSVLCWRRDADPAESRRRERIAALGALAIFFSSAFQWLFNHALLDMIAFSGLAAYAMSRAFTARSRSRAIAWLMAGAWLATCGFFPFYPPGWGPGLWLLCGAIFDVSLKSTGNVRRALPRALVAIALVGIGVALTALYYAPYLAVVRNTLYPGRRLAFAGELHWGRLLALFWPSLQESAPVHGEPGYFGKLALNVCETSAVEATPLLFLLALALVSDRVRRACARVVSGAPGTALGCAVLGVWCFVPYRAPWFRDGALLRWSPGSRTFWVFGAACAALATVAVAELERRETPAGSQARYRGIIEGATGFAILAVAWVLGRQQLAGGWRSGWGPILLTAVLLLATAFTLRHAFAPRLLALAWVVPLALATAPVNPLTRTRDLFREGAGHRIIEAAQRRAPGRIVDFGTHWGSNLAAFGWPVLASVAVAPDLDLFRFLAPAAQGMTEQVYNRYAHVYFVLPPHPLDAMLDAFRMPISPCSERLGALGVNHFLAASGEALPAECASAFDVVRVGREQLWTRRAPVGPVGAAHGAPASALDFDWSASGAGRRVALTPGRDRLTVALPAAPGSSFAIAINRSLVDEVVCRGASSRAVDAHLVFEAGVAPALCEVRYLGTRGALRRLLHDDRAATIFKAEPSAPRA
jgi:hypothetical protein